ncbi:MAG: hypothetical protein L3K17_00745 [Thermoplasmata archaeon]|nr:hypothetical protein [Thermoplasmata archaeon]
MRLQELHRRRMFVALLVVGLGIAGFSGGVIGAALTVKSGTETADGAAETGAAITWWSQTAISLATIPSPAPGVANASETTPTLLTGSNASYVFVTAKANDSALRWDFQLKTPPVLTEFELTVTILNLSASTPTSVTVYLETPATSPSGTVLVSLYFDQGAGAAGFRNVSQVSQECSAFGTCP